MTVGTRGKAAETAVKRRLEVLAKSADFAYARLPDARAGSFMPALADFMMVRQGVMTLIEVKETQHDYRLVHPNFGEDQVARMRVFQAAGASTLVLIHHSTIKRWRYGRVDQFLDRSIGGSWDLRTWPTFKLEEIL
jgi:penicillin-binding protein-related factor A (putative recombinase)